MGLAAMIIGIIAVVLGFIPLCGVIALVPAIIGLILGIIDVRKKSKAQQPKGQGLAGVILNAAAIVIILVWTLVFAAAGTAMEDDIGRLIEDMNVPTAPPPGG